MSAAKPGTSLAAPLAPDEARLSALPLPPLLPGLPLLGSGLDLLRDLPRTFIHAYRRLGPIFRVRAPGYAFTVLAGPEANLFLGRQGRAVLSSARAYHRVARALNSDHYLQAMDGAGHDHLRRALQPGFSREAICAYIVPITQSIHRAARAWPVGQLLNAGDTSMLLAAEAATMALANSAVGGLFDDLRTYVETLIGAGVAVWPPVLLRLPPFRMARARVDRYLDEIVAAHRAQPPGEARSPDLVDLVLNTSRADGAALSPADRRTCLQVAPANSLMYVGRALGFLLYDLLKHPAALARVAQEVDAVYDQGLPSPAGLRQMPAARGAVLDSLRLHPPAIVLPRSATRTFAFAGHRVDAGTLVMMGTTLAHFDPALFPNPYQFDLDRYREPRSEHRQPGAYAPFGVGEHTCLSLGLVETILMLAAATLLRTVRLRIEPANHVLRTVVNPVPGPDADFHLRVIEQRATEMPTELVHEGQAAQEELAGALPDLSPEQLARAGARLRRRSFAAGAVIVREGEPADHFYILMAGEVAVIKRTAAGEAKRLARLGPGSYFGEIGLLHGVARTATVQALTPVGVLALDRESFLGIVAEVDLTSAEIAQVVQQRYISTQLAAALPSLPIEAVRNLAPEAALRRYPPGAVIIRQGEPAEAFYIIARGRVEVINHHPSGREIRLAERTAGEFFGETGLLQGRARTATVRAAPEGEVEVLEFDQAAFQQLVTGSASTGEAVALTMVERVVETLARYEALDQDAPL